MSIKQPEGKEENSKRYDIFGSTYTSNSNTLKLFERNNCLVLNCLKDDFVTLRNTSPGRISEPKVWGIDGDLITYIPVPMRFLSSQVKYRNMSAEATIA